MKAMSWMTLAHWAPMPFSIASIFVPGTTWYVLAAALAWQVALIAGYWLGNARAEEREVEFKQREVRRAIDGMLVRLAQISAHVAAEHQRRPN